MEQGHGGPRACEGWGLWSFDGVRVVGVKTAGEHCLGLCVRLGPAPAALAPQARCTFARPAARSLYYPCFPSPPFDETPLSPPSWPVH